jgi:hypothetical protein
LRKEHKRRCRLIADLDLEGITGRYDNGTSEATSPG